MNAEDLDVTFTPAERKQVLDAIAADLTSVQASRPVEEVAHLLKRLLVGVRWSIPTLGAGTRLFRVRKLQRSPDSIADVGAPLEGRAAIGRLNNAGNSVLYLSDTPDTAIKELRLGAGTYCLSEWQVTEPRVALVNGGISDEDLHAVFGPENMPGAEIGGLVDDELRHLFRSIFTLVPDHDPTLYRWCIYAAMAGGFAHVCERTGRFQQDGHTVFKGLYPFAGIAYASVRSDKRRVNFAFNDLGRKYVDLKNVQWIDGNEDGSFSSLDFATSWDEKGAINWLGRPANFAIPAGGAAKLTKVGENVWRYETLDGDVPGFA
jgi:hypothetical protein